MLIHIRNDFGLKWTLENVICILVLPCQICISASAALSLVERTPRSLFTCLTQNVMGRHEMQSPVAASVISATLFTLASSLS